MWSMVIIFHPQRQMATAATAKCAKLQETIELAARSQESNQKDGVCDKIKICLWTVAIHKITISFVQLELRKKYDNLKEKYNRLMHAFTESQLKLRGLTEEKATFTFTEVIIDKFYTGMSIIQNKYTYKYVYNKLLYFRATMTLLPNLKSPFWTVFLAPGTKMLLLFEKRWRCSIKTSWKNWVKGPWKVRRGACGTWMEFPNSMLQSLHWLQRKRTIFVIFIISALPRELPSHPISANEFPIAILTKFWTEYFPISRIELIQTKTLVSLILYLSN